MYKKWISLGLFSALVLGMAAGCSSSDDSVKGSNAVDDTIQPYYQITGKNEDKNITVSWCLIGGNDEYYQNYWKEMKGLRAIQQITGVTIDFQVKISYDDYLPMFSSVSYPDVITANNLSKYPGRMAGMYSDGVSVRLNDYMEQWMPNFSRIVEEYSTIGRDLRLDDGSYTFVSALYDIENTDDRIASSKFGLAIRKDWLDTLGYTSVPTTMDEWHQVLLDIKQNDPNGDSLPNEEPLCLASSAWKYFLPAYGIDDDPSIQTNADGSEEVIYGYITENYKEYLTEFRKWYSEGLIYNMFENTSVEKRQEKLLGNLAGVWKGEAHMFDTQNPDSYIRKLQETVPEAEFAACPWPKTADGKHWCFSDINSFATDSTVITKRAVEKGTDQAAAYIIDYMLGENGSTLLTWGLKGESYEEKDGKKMLLNGMNDMIEFYNKTIPKKYTYADPITVMLPQFGEVSEYIQANQTKEYVDACRIWAEGDTHYKMSAACQLSVEQIKEVNDLEDTMKNYIRKMRNRFITSSAPLTEYDAYVAQVRSLGADKYIEVWSEAYKNYKKR